MRICFIGCVQSSQKLLQVLLDNQKQIVGVVTKKESQYNADFQSLGVQCEQNSIPFIYADDASENEVETFIRKCNPDVIYCFGWSRLIPHNILVIPNMGGVGFHPAELPYNRGRHPLIWALVLGLNNTATTFFKMTAEADAGDIVSQEPITITYDDDASTLYQKVLIAASRQVLELTEYAEKNGKFPIVRINEGGNTWRKRGKSDGQIDWRMGSDNIYNLIRALTHPYIGAHFCISEKEYRIWKAQVWREFVPNNLEPGKILQVNSGHDFVVKTGDGAIHILDCDEVSLKKGEYLK